MFDIIPRIEDRTGGNYNVGIFAGLKRTDSIINHQGLGGFDRQSANSSLFTPAVPDGHRRLKEQFFLWDHRSVSVDAKYFHAALLILIDDANDLTSITIKLECTRPGHDRNITFCKFFPDLVCIKRSVVDNDFQIHFIVEHTNRRLDYLVLLRMNDDWNLAAEQRLEVLQTQIELWLFSFAFQKRVMLANVVFPFQQLLTDDVVHTHSPGTCFATTSFRVSGLSDLQHARSTNDDILCFAGAALHQDAKPAHVGPAARNVADGCDAAGDGDLQLVVMRNDLIPVSKLGIGLVNHLVQISRTTDVAVSFHKSGHRELIRVINNLVAFRHFGFFSSADRFNLAVLDQNGSIGDWLTCTREDFSNVNRDSLRIFIGLLGIVVSHCECCREQTQ